ncbi:hypothetical protein PLEOSDRAFT_163784 [Pleurotus ostreatus PC15]|uniref:Uncharacterized protein n=1 Tax=Pleurotus ostreatus (strain PC15) TaxID=1137138 RepID=A0A067NFM1_PLEO1|nr:hypothetical protein PLEOSDRAFT_163784 [Pleurotus ostreatus PC15]
MPYQDRLKELIGHRKAWATLSWRQSSLRIPGDIEEPNLYGFVAGVFAKLLEHYMFVTLHLPTMHESNNRWMKRRLSFPAKEFVMDPTQDLVIFLEEDTRPWSYNGQRSVCLHVQTLSTGDPHPLARNAILTFDIPPHPDESGRNDIWFSSIKLAVDIILMQYSVSNEGEEGMHFQFWNWKTGHGWLISGYIEFTQCSFISPRAVVFASAGETSPSLNVCTFEYDPETTETTTTHKANLHLPEAVSDSCFDVTAIQTPAILDLAYVPPSKIIAPPLESHINIVSLELTVDDDEHELCLFVPNSILLNYASNPPVGEVPWKDWGQGSTRLVEMNRIYMNSSYASRVICSSLDPDNPTSIHILDFNPRRRQENSLSTTDHGLTQRTYSIQSATSLGLFKDDVYNGLPVWCTTRPLSSSYSALFIDDERIVGVKEEPSDELSDDSDCEDADILAF